MYIYYTAHTRRYIFSCKLCCAANPTTQRQDSINTAACGQGMTMRRNGELRVPPPSPALVKLALGNSCGNAAERRAHKLFADLAAVIFAFASPLQASRRICFQATGTSRISSPRSGDKSLQAVMSRMSTTKLPFENNNTNRTRSCRSVHEALPDCKATWTSASSVSCENTARSSGCHTR